MSPMSILVVEDEVNLGTTLVEYLTELGHDCYWAKNIARAKELLKAHRLEFILLDIGLPDGNGIEFAKKVKIQNSSQKIIFLSAQNSPDIKLEGLEVGAEDYITKPFRLKELMLRLKSSPPGKLKRKMNLLTFQQET